MDLGQSKPHVDIKIELEGSKPAKECVVQTAY